MCTETGTKDVYQGVQGACPQQAVTHAGGTAERSERHAIGMGLRVCSDANATPGVVCGLGVDGISKRPNTAIT